VRIPSGTVTLLFTDIEGSTRLWEEEPEPMAAALRRHDEILRTAIESAAGYVFKTVGDAFCAAFMAAGPAVDAALTAQRQLTAEQWPTSRPIKVRMSLHTGACEERDADYFGPVVNRAARLEAVAHGGQVLLSGATAELLPGVSLADLGQHRLKDLGRPEHVFQLEADFLPASFPPLASLDSPELPNNLPSLLSAFIGRDREQGEVRDLIRAARLVTLTGAGGSGKTRLALQAAAEQIGVTADGVWFVELAALTEAAQVPRAVGAALGLPDQGGQWATDSIARALGGQEAVIVLDNCEHLIDAVAKFSDVVIRHCPRVRFLATSREPLGIDGERVYRVPSLSLPPPDAECAEDLAASDAVRLFVERARVRDGGFALEAESAPLVATICRRLDGIPLALELAAARLSSMSLAQVAARLDQRFRLLTGGSRNALPRQQTLQATVDWSFSLLNPAERSTLTRLSVFAGGFDLEAAEQVCCSESVDALDIMDLLSSLVDKSLVVAERTADSMRYRLLETIRQYCAQELLRAEGDAGVAQIRSRHADYYLALAQTAAPALMSRGQRDWFRRLDAEWDNLRAALAHLDAENRTADVLALGVALGRFAASRAHGELLAPLRRAVEAGGEPSARHAEASFTVLALMLLFDRSNPDLLPTWKRLSEHGLDIAVALGNRGLESRALGMLAGLAYFTGDQEAGRRHAADSVALAREVGDAHLLGELLGNLALTGSPEQNRSARLEALDCFRRCGDDLLAAGELSMLYGLDLHAGRLDDAEGHLVEAVALAEPLGDEVFLFFFLSDLAVLRIIQGRHADAAPVVRRCLLAMRRTGIEIGSAGVIFGAACCSAADGQAELAARLHGAADAAISASLADKIMLWSDAEQSAQRREQGQVRDVMGDAAFDEAFHAGARLGPAEAAAVALGREP